MISDDFAFFGFPGLGAPPKEPKDPKRAKWSPEILAVFASRP